ncbi:hypothetical protein P3T76_003120 [Phytophthora citrophthora]|uniref:FCH domain-containing protein n=1 Tax=Phytophthora citrophthora TaxID=4793 RepID=A0AAD9LT46_9STRA|nr:hypothetical protein P3T76_003120 [Phytophthora citrophthora]
MKSPAHGRASPAPDLTFATDLLFNFEEVRADCASGLAAHGNLVAMLKSRIGLERTYAQELNKMARASHFDNLEHGTMKNAMESLRAQYLNTSVQHQLLAKNLEEDVLRPIEILFEYNSQRAQSLANRINNAKKDAKAHEDTYRKYYNAFDKSFREASASFSAAMDSGFSSTALEDLYHHRLSQIEDADSPAKAQSSTVVTARNEKAHGAVALKVINNHKLVSWLRSSSETHRKEDLAKNTVKLMTAAEKSRRKCQQTWQGVEKNRIRMYRVVQRVLADYQQIAEDRIFTIATNLRKHVVFAASTLANEQYDWQVVAPKFENVNVKSDIYDFIHTTRGSKTRLLLTVNDLCNDTSRSLTLSPTSKPCRPLRKTCLEIRDISSRKIPFDYDDNQELLSEALGTRSRAQPQQQRQEDQEELAPNGLSINCGLASIENANSVSQLEIANKMDVEEEDKSSTVQDNEPEIDNSEHSPNASPSASSSSLTRHLEQSTFSEEV